MKKIIIMLTAAACLGSVNTILADEGNINPEKNLCAVYSQNCPDPPLDIQQLLKLLRGEIAKGRRVYTEEELKKLENNLRFAETIWEYVSE